MSVLELTAEEYHADPADTPSLTSSIANLLLKASPAHARAAHPRLNPDFERKQEEKFEAGTVVHQLLLEGTDRVWVIGADDYRMKDTRLMRDDARERGQIPMLTHQWHEVQQMVAAIRPVIDAYPIDPPLLTGGKPEQTLVWDEAGVTCRARVDWLLDDYSAITDVKTTSRSANPSSWERSLFEYGYDVQAALYRRGVRALCGSVPGWRWVVAERQPPYAVAVLSLAPDALDLAEAKLDHALSVWRRCLDEDVWPSYPQRVAYVSAPPWEEARFLEMRDREAAA